MWSGGLKQICYGSLREVRLEHKRTILLLNEILCPIGSHLSNNSYELKNISSIIVNVTYLPIDHYESLNNQGSI